MDTGGNIEINLGKNFQPLATFWPTIDCIDHLWKSTKVIFSALRLIRIYLGVDRVYESHKSLVGIFILIPHVLLHIGQYGL